jgi:Tfp pilus assembly protein FimT
MTVAVLGVIMVFANIQLYLTVRMSQMREDVKSLSQEIALLRNKTDRVAADGERPKTADAAKPDTHGIAAMGEAGHDSGWLPAPEKTGLKRR